MNAAELLAELRIQAAGPAEVEASPASTRGTADSKDPSRRRQRAYVRVESHPWPNSLSQADCDAWRAEACRRRDEADAACGAPSVVANPDSDEAEDALRAERRRVHVLYHVIDGDGAEWVDCPVWELEDLPQPLNVIQRREVPVLPPARKPEPVVVEFPEVAPARASTRSLMTEEQVELALRLLDEGQTMLQVSGRYWQEWGFASRKSCEFSLRRRRGALANQRNRQEAIAA